MLGSELAVVENSETIKSSVLTRLFLKLLGFWCISTRVRGFHLAKALSMVGVEHATEILDAGCGNGIYSLHLARRVPHLSITGIDNDAKYIATAEEAQIKGQIPNARFLHSDIQSYVSKARFDIIICIDVLEHIADDGAVLTKFCALLLSGGHLLLHVPLQPQKRFFKRFLDYHHPDHVRQGYRVNDLQGLLQAAGLQVVHTERTFQWPGALVWELTEMLFPYKPLYLAVFPLLLLLARLDAHLGPFRREGNAVMIVAQRGRAVPEQLECVR